MAPGVQDEYVHKNRLLQISLKLFAQIPTFETPNEGLQHDPKFRPSVVVDGTKITSPLTFNRRKDAEQYVSKMALEHLYTNLRKDGYLQINNTTTFCKSILHEFAAKKKISLPAYTTSNVEGILPMFKTSVTFNGNTFNGILSRNKKDAEQFGARSVIQWILDQSDDRSITIAEIIKIKHKLFKETHESCNLPLVDENNPPLQTIVQGHPFDTQVAESIPPALEKFKGKPVAIELPAAVSDSQNAEQYASKMALEHLHTNLRKDGYLQINNTTTFCKSILHEFAAKEKISLPAYTTSNVEGMLPMFKTSVTFDGNTFNGSLSRNKKDAEQFGARSVIQLILDQSDDRSITIAGHPSDTQGPAVADALPPALEKFKGKLVAIELPAAVSDSQNAQQYVSKMALEHLHTNLRKDGYLQINNTTTFCKSVLHEFAAKEKISLPVYTTSNVEGMLPMFKTSVTFDGNTFNSSLSRNKKDAEEFGARSVIQWILNQSDDRSNTIVEIIKRKYKLFKDTHESCNLSLVDENIPPCHPSDTQGPAVADAIPPALEKFKGKPLAIELPAAVSDSQNIEQYVSKMALEHLHTNLRKDGYLQINNTTTFCKFILHEFTAKERISLPAYTTPNVEGMLPMFKTYVTFDGNTFNGSLSRNRKDTEQFGARSVIQWILDQFDDRSITIALQTIVPGHPSDTQVEDAIPPTLEIFKGKPVAIELLAAVSDCQNAEIKSNKSAAVDLASISVNQISVNSCIGQTVKVEVEVEESFEASPSTVNSPNGKRLRTKNKRSSAKKLRMDECTLAGMPM